MNRTDCVEQLEKLFESKSFQKDGDTVLENHCYKVELCNETDDLLTFSSAGFPTICAVGKGRKKIDVSSFDCWADLFNFIKQDLEKSQFNFDEYRKILDSAVEICKKHTKIPVVYHYGSLNQRPSVDVVFPHIPGARLYRLETSECGDVYVEDEYLDIPIRPERWFNTAHLQNPSSGKHVVEIHDGRARDYLLLPWLLQKEGTEVVQTEMILEKHCALPPDLNIEHYRNLLATEHRKFFEFNVL